MAVELKFIKFGYQSVNAASITRAHFEIADSKRSVVLLLYVNDGHLLSIPYEDPVCKPTCELLGFEAEYAAWPKQKAAADAKFKADQDQRQAEQKQAALRRARGFGMGG